MANPKYIRAIDPLRGARNPFSSGYRRIINEALETIYEIQKWREKIQGLIAERFQPAETVTIQKFPVRLISASVIGSGVWRYLGVRVRTIASGHNARPTYTTMFLQDTNVPWFIFNIFNRAEEWNPTAPGLTTRQSYGIRARDVDQKDDFCVRLLPIGRSDANGVFAEIEPEGSSQVVVEVQAEKVELEDPKGVTVTWYFFNAGNEVDVECCPECETFPPGSCQAPP